MTIVSSEFVITMKLDSHELRNKFCRMLRCFLVVYKDNRTPPSSNMINGKLIQTSFGGGASDSITLPGENESPISGGKALFKNEPMSKAPSSLLTMFIPKRLKSRETLANADPTLVMGTRDSVGSDTGDREAIQKQKKNSFFKRVFGGGV